MGRLSDAITLALKTIDDMVRVYGNDAKRTLESRLALAEVYRVSGKLSEAEKICREVLAGFKKIQSPMSVDIRITMSSLGRTLMAAGKLEEAKNIFQDILKFMTEVFGRSHACTLVIVSLLARCIALGGNHERAIK